MPYNNRGLAFAAKGDFEKALADFSEAVKLNPEFAEALPGTGDAAADDQHRFAGAGAVVAQELLFGDDVDAIVGERFDQQLASELAQLDRLVLICGRYEGVDERVGTHLADREISIGDYVLSGGELGAAVIIDAVTRLIPGAVGNEASTRQESFFAGPEFGGDELADKSVRPTSADSTCGSGGLLDYPHYTRPAEFRGVKVPEVLLNGNHEEIRRWRRRSALEKTLHNRPDLLDRGKLSDGDKELIAEIEAIAGKQ